MPPHAHSKTKTTVHASQKLWRACTRGKWARKRGDSSKATTIRVHERILPPPLTPLPKRKRRTKKKKAKK